MYRDFFGLQSEPFPVTPDPEMLYLTANHRDALAGLTYAILMKRGFAVLTGDTGTGKTTVVSRILQTLSRKSTTFSVILNPALTASEFLESVMLDFGLGEVPDSKARKLQQLHQFLLAEHAAERTTVLIIDEAQRLSENVLEEVRLLSNCELPDQKLLQIILSGQSELEGLLESRGLRQLKQRLAVWVRIAPLERQDVFDYMRFRWTKAGGAKLPFEPAALNAIADYSRGIPRTVNILSDNSLLLAFGDAAPTVTPVHVDAVAKYLALGRHEDAMQAEAAAVSRAIAESSLVCGPAEAIGAEVPLILEPLPTLRRYEATTETQSRLSRWAAKVGWTRRADGIV
jgi:general secretion pathway protein A